MELHKYLYHRWFRQRAHAEAQAQRFTCTADQYRELMVSAGVTQQHVNNKLAKCFVVRRVSEDEPWCATNMQVQDTTREHEERQRKRNYMRQYMVKRRAEGKALQALKATPACQYDARWFKKNGVSMPASYEGGTVWIKTPDGWQDVTA